MWNVVTIKDGEVERRSIWQGEAVTKCLRYWKELHTLVVVEADESIILIAERARKGVAHPRLWVCIRSE